MKSVCTFDLETIADENVLQYLPPMEPKKNLKDPEKIAADIAEKERKRRAELAMNPVSARICCFGWHDGKESHSIMLEEEGGQAEEYKLLRQAWDVLSQFDEFVTFNGISFDVPVLLMRSAICRVRPSVKISTRKYQVDNHYDLRAILGQWDRYASGTLDFYCGILLGHKAKPDDIDGSQVQDYWDAGLRDEIAKYCEGDCLATWELFKVVKRYYLI